MTTHELPFRDTTVEVAEGETVAEFRERVDAAPDTDCVIVKLRDDVEITGEDENEVEDYWGHLQDSYVVHAPPKPEQMYAQFRAGYVLDFR